MKALALGISIIGLSGCSTHLENRVRYLEKVIAPNDPDGLLEDPDLYRDESERSRFYRLWERTECGP